jgi:Flp pilus assembly pilin Flp
MSGDASMKYFLKKFILSEQGATSVEYAIMASLIAAVIAGTVLLLGQTVFGLFNSIHF